MRTRRGGLLPYCIVAGSMSLGYGSIYTLLADLRDRYGFTEAQLGYIVAAGFLAGMPTLMSRGAVLVEQLDSITRDGLVLAPETVAAIGQAEARRGRWVAIALWLIAALLAWLVWLLLR